MSKKRKIVVDFPEEWLENERRVCLAQDPLANHTTLNHRMRTVVIAWLREVCQDHNDDLAFDIFFMAIHIMDRYLAVEKDPVTVITLQLIAVTAYMIASKFIDEDDVCVTPKGCAWLCDDAYSRQQIIDAEMKILTTLNWDVFSVPLCQYVRHLMRYKPLAIRQNALNMAVSIISEGTTEANSSVALQIHQKLTQKKKE